MIPSTSSPMLAETLIPLRDVPPMLPAVRRNGNFKPVHISAIYRWATRGVRGGIKLETVQLPSGRATSKEAVHRFLDRLTMASNGALLACHTTRQRQNTRRKAEEILAKAGI